jgi:hypothetical protein
MKFGCVANHLSCPCSLLVNVLSPLLAPVCLCTESLPTCLGNGPLWEQLLFSEWMNELMNEWIWQFSPFCRGWYSMFCTPSFPSRVKPCYPQEYLVDITPWQFFPLPILSLHLATLASTALVNMSVSWSALRGPKKRGSIEHTQGLNTTVSYLKENTYWTGEERQLIRTGGEKSRLKRWILVNGI